MQAIVLTMKDGERRFAQIKTSLLNEQTNRLEIMCFNIVTDDPNTVASAMRLCKQDPNVVHVEPVLIDIQERKDGQTAMQENFNVDPNSHSGAIESDECGGGEDSSRTD